MEMNERIDSLAVELGLRSSLKWIIYRMAYQTAEHKRENGMEEKMTTKRKVTLTMAIRMIRTMGKMNINLTDETEIEPNGRDLCQ